jgi:hypothetical protein
MWIFAWSLVTNVVILGVEMASIISRVTVGTLLEKLNNLIIEILYFMLSSCIKIPGCGIKGLMSFFPSMNVVGEMSQNVLWNDIDVDVYSKGGNDLPEFLIANGCRCLCYMIRYSFKAVD